MTPRPCVQAFAREMERRLAANDHKGGWQDATDAYLFRRLLEEVGELYSALTSGPFSGVISEAADVANFAMMLADPERQP